MKRVQKGWVRDSQAWSSPHQSQLTGSHQSPAIGQHLQVRGHRLGSLRLERLQGSLQLSLLQEHLSSEMLTELSSLPELLVLVPAIPRAALALGAARAHVATGAGTGTGAGMIIERPVQKLVSASARKPRKL